jgi:hypothetical protein
MSSSQFEIRFRLWGQRFGILTGIAMSGAHEMLASRRRSDVDPLPMRAFRVKTEQKPNPGAWNSTIVSIFEGDQLLGSYERWYPAFGETTFHPFERDEKWYALYSGDYTCTRLMSLPDCRDIGGEEPNPRGFCPVEFYVPRYRKVTYVDTKYGSGQTCQWYAFDNAERFRRVSDPEEPRYDYGSWQFLETGFVAGCIWGDDTSWKVEVLDLTRAAEGLITRTARFGHFELPHKQSLKDSIDFLGWKPDRPLITVVRQETRNLDSGEAIDPYDL